MNLQRVVGLRLPVLFAVLLWAALSLASPTLAAAQEKDPEGEEAIPVGNFIISMRWGRPPHTDSSNFVNINVYRRAPGDIKGPSIIVPPGDFKVWVRYEAAKQKKLEPEGYPGGSGSVIALVSPAAPGRYIFSVSVTIEGQELSADFKALPEVIIPPSDLYPPLNSTMWQATNAATEAQKDAKSARTEVSALQTAVLQANQKSDAAKTTAADAGRDASAALTEARGARTVSAEALTETQGARTESKKARVDVVEALRAAIATNEDAQRAREAAEAALIETKKASASPTAAAEAAEAAVGAAQQAQTAASEAQTQVQEALALVNAMQKAVEEARGEADRSRAEAEKARGSVDRVARNTQLAFMLLAIGVVVGVTATLMGLLGLLAGRRRR
jgi:hypothetical protein